MQNFDGHFLSFSFALPRVWNCYYDSANFCSFFTITVKLRHHIDGTEFHASASVPQHIGYSEVIIGNLKTVLSCNLYLYTIFDQRRLDIIDQVEHGRSPQQVTHLPPVWDRLLPLA